MKSAIILRDASTDQGTPGRIYFGTDKLACLELPDLGNLPEVSCVLAGTYDAVWDYSRHLDRFCYHLIDDETGRTGIRIHSGNFAGDSSKGWQTDVEGCILLGLIAGNIANREGKMQTAVLDSHLALEHFNLWGNRDTFKLTIQRQAA